MEGCPFLPLPEGLRITQICQEESVLVISAVSERRKLHFLLLLFPKPMSGGKLVIRALNTNV